MCKLAGVAVDQLGCLHEATVRDAGGAKGGVANGTRTLSCCAESSRTDVRST